MDERNKTMFVAKKKEEYRRQDLERIQSDYGAQLRINRSIQVEGSFAVEKEDMNFRKYSYRGKEAVLAQTILVAIAYNFSKLYHKIQNNRTGTYLFWAAAAVKFRNSEIFKTKPAIDGRIVPIVGTPEAKFCTNYAFFSETPRFSTIFGGNPQNHQ